jgi:diaminopimelate decarboxylase
MAELGVLAQQYGRDPRVKLRGLHAHLGSPIYLPELYADAIQKLLGLAAGFSELGVRIDTLDIGGGFCSVYGGERLPAIESFAEAAVPLLRSFVDEGGRVILEPGRSIAATAGILAAEVLYTKCNGLRQFAVLDAGMSHLIRPALYDAFHFMWPIRPRTAAGPQWFAEEPGVDDLVTYDVVGPICETGDLFARDRRLPELRPGDRVALFSCGAYGMTMASHYNAVCNPVEVLVSGSEYRVIRRREQYVDLVRAEEDLV